MHIPSNTDRIDGAASSAPHHALSAPAVPAPSRPDATDTAPAPADPPPASTVPPSKKKPAKKQSASRGRRRTKIAAKRAKQRGPFEKKSRRRYPNATEADVTAAADHHIDKLKRKGRRPIVPVILMIFGFTLLMFPIISDFYASYIASKAVTSYTQRVEEISAEDRERMIAEAIAYNHRLSGIYDDADTPFADVGYQDILDPFANGVMGTVEIECIGVTQPIYHGTSDSVLMVGAGHMEGSSFPLRTGGSHAAVAGHTGMPGQRMFDEVKNLEPGDIVKVSILDRVTIYQVDSSEVVSPGWRSSFDAPEGEDWLTLVTCTPYGINDHRLLVHCKAAAEERQQELFENPGFDKLSKFINIRTLPVIAIVLVALASAIISLVRAFMRRKAKNGKQEKKSGNAIQQSNPPR